MFALERAWFAARRAVAGRRRHSRAAAAIDIMAAAPLVSATSLAAGLDMAVKNAAALLDAFCAAGIAVEVTHRAKRRLFGLTGLAPLRDAVRPPYRPEPGRGRGRPRLDQPDDAGRPAGAALPPVPLTPLDRRAFDYSDLSHWMTHMEQTIRHTRRTLATLNRRAIRRCTQAAETPCAKAGAAPYGCCNERRGNTQSGTRTGPGDDAGYGATPAPEVGRGGRRSKAWWLLLREQMPPRLRRSSDLI